jgi:hypothetical protein
MEAVCSSIHWVPVWFTSQKTLGLIFTAVKTSISHELELYQNTAERGPDIVFEKSKQTIIFPVLLVLKAIHVKGHRVLVLGF